jgi:hypothetical protein
MQEIHCLLGDVPDIHADIGMKVAEAQQAANDACTTLVRAISAANRAADAHEKRRLCEEATQGYKEVKNLCDVWHQRTGTD